MWVTLPSPTPTHSGAVRSLHMPKLFLKSSARILFVPPRTGGLPVFSSTCSTTLASVEMHAKNRVEFGPHYTMQCPPAVTERTTRKTLLLYPRERQPGSVDRTLSGDSGHGSLWYQLYHQIHCCGTLDKFLSEPLSYLVSVLLSQAVNAATAVLYCVYIKCLGRAGGGSVLPVIGITATPITHNPSITH